MGCDRGSNDAILEDGWTKIKEDHQVRYGDYEWCQGAAPGLTDPHSPCWLTHAYSPLLITLRKQGAGRAQSPEKGQENW
jgi:hypothetical protein